VDDKKLQGSLKRMGLNPIPGIEEVQIISGDEMIQFTNPRVQASPSVRDPDIQRFSDLAIQREK